MDPDASSCSTTSAIPLEMGSKEINAFLSHLASRNVASSTQNQALCSIVFLYKTDSD